MTHFNTLKLWTTAAACCAACCARAQWNSDSTEYDSFEKFRLGGYGEMVAAFKDYGINRFNGTSDGNSRMNRATISIPRFVIAGDYKFTERWTLGVEIEFEAGGVGTEYEIENTENGEYETEAEMGGEVALEQFHITYRLNPYFNVRAGHVIVPVGLTNTHHEPVNFFGTVRPEGESTIVPSTWHETGLEIFGQFGRRWASFDYQLQLVEGLNANGFDRNTWVGSGKQGLFEADNFTSPAYVARLNYKGVPGLRLGGSAYYCANTAANADKPKTYSFEAPLLLWSADLQYSNRWVTLRANALSGHLGNSTRLSAANVRQSNKSPYTRTSPIAESAVSYGGEIGLNIKGFVSNPKMPGLTPFVRYEYYNAQEKVSTDSYYSTPADPRLKTSMWTFGVNYKPLPYLVIKADYTIRKIGDGQYTDENEFALGVAFVGWYSGTANKKKRQTETPDGTYSETRSEGTATGKAARVEELSKRLEAIQKELEQLKQE